MRNTIPLKTQRKWRFQEVQHFSDRCLFNLCVEKRPGGTTKHSEHIYSVSGHSCIFYCNFLLLMCHISLSRCLTIKYYCKNVACCPVQTLASGVVRTGSGWVHARAASLCNTLQRDPVKEHTVQGTGSVNIWLLLAEHVLAPYISFLMAAQNPGVICARFTLLNIRTEEGDSHLLHLKPS